MAKSVAKGHKVYLVGGGVHEVRNQFGTIRRKLDQVGSSGSDERLVELVKADDSGRVLVNPDHVVAVEETRDS